MLSGRSNHAVRGYWIVRFLEEAHPGFVRALLAERRAPATIERQVADQLGMNSGSVWLEIGATVVEYFRRKSLAAS